MRFETVPPEAQRDESTERMLSSFARDRARMQAEAGPDDWCMDAKTQAENDADELALFNRAESRAINSGAW